MIYLKKYKEHSSDLVIFWKCVFVSLYICCVYKVILDGYWGDPSTFYVLDTHAVPKPEYKLYFHRNLSPFLFLVFIEGEKKRIKETVKQSHCSDKNVPLHQIS